MISNSDGYGAMKKIKQNCVTISGWGPGKPPGGGGVWAETWMRQTRQQALGWGDDVYKASQVVIRVEQVWRPQERCVQAPGELSWTLKMDRVPGPPVPCADLALAFCPLSYVITPSGSLPRGAESVTQWDQQGLYHQGQPQGLAHNGASAGGFWMTLRWGRWGCVAERKLHRLSSCESPGENWVHFL